MKVFDFLHHTVLENESIYKEVLYLFWFLVKWIQSSMHFMCVCRHRIIFGLCKSHVPKEIVLFTSITSILLNLNTRHFLYLCWTSMFNHPCPFHTRISVATKCMNYYTFWLHGSARLFYLECSRFQFSLSWVFCSKLFLRSFKEMMD
jgi:hypothetical protein